MKFLNYIRTLLPTFGKDKVLESCELTRNSIAEHTLPAYETAVTLWKGQKFKSTEVLAFSTAYLRKVNSSPKNLLESVTKALSNGLVVTQLLSDNIKKLYADNEANVSLTFLKTTLLRMVQSAEYANTYSRRLLNYIYVCETQKEMGISQAQLTPAEIKWIENGFDDFCVCINILLMDVKQIEKGLNQLPDAVVTDLTEKTFLGTMGEGKLDPFQMRHLSTKWNPFYLLGMFAAKGQADRYKAAQQELELIQLRKLQLEKLHSKTQDAKLEKEIEYLQDRVSSMNYKLEKMEETYGLD